MSALREFHVARLIRDASRIGWSYSHPHEMGPAPTLLIRSNASTSRYDSIDRTWLARMAETSSNPGYAALDAALAEYDRHPELVRSNTN